MTAVNIVTTPEEMPVTETIELVGRLRAEVECAARIRDREPGAPGAFTHSDEETSSRRCASPKRWGAHRSGSGAGAVEALDAARLAVSLRRTRAVHLKSCARPSNLPLLYVPYLFVRDHGLRVTRMVADASRRGARSVSPAPEAKGPSRLEQLFATKEIVVCCGSGGVGKTSVAAAAALRRGPAGVGRRWC